MQNTLFGKRNWTILLLFGLIGQIAWSVENMYFNLFVFETIAPDLDAVTLMVQLSGVDIMTTRYIPAPEIFLTGAIVGALTVIIVPFLIKATAKKEQNNEA